MSITIISNKTFLAVGSTIKSYQIYGPGQDMQWSARQIGDVTYFVNVLHKANKESYANRYKEDFLVDRLEFPPNQSRIDRFQLLKSLECIRYNIEVPLKCEDKLNKLIESIMRDIISEMEEYEEAEWE